MNMNATENLVVAVAIENNDKDKSSLDAVRWTLDNVVGRGHLIFLIHVNTNPAYRNEERYKREIFNPFRLFCARKGVKCKDICLRGSNVAETIVEYISQNPIDMLIVGESSTNNISTRSTTAGSGGISSNIRNGSPDFCTVYVISNGKPSSIKKAVRQAPTTSPLRAELLQHMQKKKPRTNEKLSFPNCPSSGMEGAGSSASPNNTLEDRKGTGASPNARGSASGSHKAPSSNPSEIISTEGSGSCRSQSSSSSLQDNLNRFQLQQHKCQSTLTSIAADRVTSSSSASHCHGKPPRYPTGAKFSSNIERLQQINTVRKSPVGAQMKRVIDLLFQSRKVLTAEQIDEECFVDIYGNTEVFDGLKNNPKVKFDGKSFSYKSKHDLKNRSHLLSLIRKYPEGLPVEDVSDAYPSVMDDLKALKAEGQVWILSNAHSKEDVVYPNDPKIIVNVDDEVKLLFREIQLPKDMVDVEKELSKNGMKPATNTAKRRATAEITGLPHPKSSKAKKRKREITKRTKLTNAHLPELFEK